MSAPRVLLSLVICLPSVVESENSMVERGFGACVWEKLFGTKKAISVGLPSIVGSPSRLNVCSYGLSSGKGGNLTM